jgi:hypothetical protein
MWNRVPRDMRGRMAAHIREELDKAAKAVKA